MKRDHKGLDRETISLFLILAVLTLMAAGGLHWALNAPSLSSEREQVLIPASK